ncbi:MAG: DUF4234 domain-containing protein [Eubacteriales bacterium]
MSQNFNSTNSQLPRLKTDRSMWKLILLSMITFGIYAIVAYCEMVNSMNTIATKYDGKNTMHYLLAIIVSSFTCGIYGMIWCHGYCNRMGEELQRRGINYQFNANTFWLWGILGGCIIVGPFVFLHKQIEAMNLLSRDFNEKG